MDKKQVIKITNNFIRRLTEEIQPKKIVLYGSWIEGHPDVESDIDIAVILGSINTDYLEQLTRLYQIASKIDIRIEPVLFEENNDPSGFLRKILDQGEVMYEHNSIP